ncbi:murein biosynthesis integral membrane protein MurJ [Candidatus Methylacidithermus pantelleriae]|uniref:Probable lipid II flippase MurJ n=1 Tax=Candidatus Methylacidithermus pantelleriae TaxID=2744239 RepID=A0A8J2FNL9_9BACT|nr:murein biosynthesis integral membrane protein MurJ [Candidatus Methylacidithermus pantelleriae]CAF0693573.1 putative lipid II flippase MurJ [Candidatus Methylacidithermus pantelleriae]
MKEELSTHRAAALVSAAVALSRVFGLLRELVFAAMFGAGKLLDAYLAAFQIPNLLRDLFAEGALSTAFTTVFAKTWEKEGSEASWKLANRLFSALFTFMALVSLLGILSAPALVWITNFGFSSVPGKLELTIVLTRILFPFILLVSLAASAMGILNARSVFGPPASASTAFNIVSVLLGVLLAYLFDPQNEPFHPRFGPRALYGVCFGVLLGGLAQLAIQVPPLSRLGYRYRWDTTWNDPHLQEIWKLMLPTLLAGAAVQINVLVNGAFASQINGARSWLSCAFRLMQFPIGVFGVAIATVTLPAVARDQSRADFPSFGRRVRESLRLAFFLTVPSSLGLAVLAEPLVRLIYQHGRFTADDTLQTAGALQVYALGLSSYAAIKVLSPCFYALDLPQIPLRVSLIGITINFLLNWIFMHLLHLGHLGLALSTSAVATLNCWQLWRALPREVATENQKGWSTFSLKLSLAAAACTIVAYALEHGWVLQTRHGYSLALSLFTTVVTAAGVYFVAGRWLTLPEATLLLQAARARWARIYRGLVGV